MIWLRDLFLGIFTRHLGAKLLALLLSVGLFGFVQASLTGTQEIPELNLQFKLGEELENDYVLLSRRFDFKGLKITGMRSKVDPLARVYRGNPVVSLTIDQRFLNLYGNKDKNGDVIRIPVDYTLFHDDRLFGKDIAVGTLPDVSVILDPLVSKKDVRVAISSGVSKVLPPDHEFGKLALSFNVKSVTLRGPGSAFVASAEPTVFVSVAPRIEDQLTRFPMPGEKGTVRLSGVVIQWKEGNIVEGFVPFLHIDAPELSSEPLDPAEFQRRLEVSCDVVKRKAKLTITVPIEIRYPVPRKYDLVDDWVLFPRNPGTMTSSDLKAGVQQQLDVALPASLKGDKDFLGNLALVLDVAAATEDTEAEILKVPFYLDLKDRSREGDLASLAQVDIVPEAVAEFRKEPK